jgi:hypothetical protein
MCSVIVQLKKEYRLPCLQTLTIFSAALSAEMPAQVQEHMIEILSIVHLPRRKRNKRSFFRLDDLAATNREECVFALSAGNVDVERGIFALTPFDFNVHF